MRYGGRLCVGSTLNSAVDKRQSGVSKKSAGRRVNANVVLVLERL